MSDGLNRVILLGNLGGDPELRYTANGTAVLSFRLATNESYMDKNKEVQERTDWHTVVVWGTRGEALARTLTKGTSLLVEGGLRTSSYEKDGVKRYKTEVHAREVCIASRRHAPPPADDEMSARAPMSARADEDHAPRVPTTPRNGRSGAIHAPLDIGVSDEMPF